METQTQESDLPRQCRKLKKKNTNTQDSWNLSQLQIVDSSNKEKEVDVDKEDDGGDQEAWKKIWESRVCGSFVLFEYECYCCKFVVLLN